jgi:dipeptidyl aminopeptidase/acylaminoacyl peptidase
MPHGSWPSPITVEMASGAAHGLSGVRPDGDTLLFLESRPEEAGRVVLVRREADGTTTDVVGPDVNVRTRVHEYGGGAYVVRDGVVVHSEFATNGLTLIAAPGAAPRRLVDDPALRFADMELDLPRRRVLTVLEDQRASTTEPRNLLSAVSLEDGTVTELVSGHDFFSDPRLDPAGRHLAWLSWDHPNMPWDASDLWVAELGGDGSVGEPMHIAGGPGESIVQPTWAPDGSLVFVSDRSGWWNLHRWRAGASGSLAVAPMEAEFAEPQWVFGLRTFDIDADGTIVAVARSRGCDRLVVLAPGQALRRQDLEATNIGWLRVQDGQATFVAGSPTRPSAIVRLDLATGEQERLREASRLEVDPGYLSVPRFVDFDTTDGRTAHAWYYPPTNPDVAVPTDERPPLVVMSHGGPTDGASTSLSLTRQAFTSRGFAVVDVDYGGSSGYGRAYRDVLRGRWGEVDVDDCVAAARYLVAEGLADADRLAIRGGSAGGFTTLAALCFRDVFRAGTTFYGVGDLEALARFTHKFESRYLDGMVGPWPEAAEIYRQRSPVHHVDAISCPVLVMQGTDDLVVPRAQADDIVAALERRGLPRAYLLFEGEGHGFRRAENQERALAAELSFYAQVFGIALADDFEPLHVEGLAGWSPPAA